MLKPRYRAFLEELPKNKNSILASAVKAGYSKSYANSNGKTLLKNAIKQTAIDITGGSLPTGEIKKLMCEIIGMSSQEVFNALNNIANNKRDYASALKVLGPLSKELGIILQTDEQVAVTVPILNVVVEKSNELSEGMV